MAISRGEGEEVMRLSRLAFNVVGAFLLLLGVIWILQGTNILPGGFVTRVECGQPLAP
jgi:hypothetical protein